MEIISEASSESEAIIYKGEVYDYYDSGNTRDVYTNSDKTRVIKLLTRDFQDSSYNLEEEAIYRRSSDENRALMASTEIDENGVVIQEFCIPVKFSGKPMTIKQTLFAEQCRNEVGWNRDGELICFDLDEFKQH